MSEGPVFGSTGYGGVSDAQRQTELSRRPGRFFLKYVEKQPAPEAEIIFITDQPFAFWEHQPPVGGQQWGNFFPCNQGIWPGDPSCIMCRTRSIPDRYYIGLYTIIDCSEFSYEGTIYKNKRRILAAKLDTIKLLQKKIETYGTPERPGIVGKRFLVSRTSAKSARVGNVFDYRRDEAVERDPQTGLFQLSDRQYWWEDREGNHHAPTPFEYAKIYQALPNAELASLLQIPMPGQPNQGDVFDRQIAQQQQQQGQPPQQGYQQPPQQGYQQPPQQGYQQPSQQGYQQPQHVTGQVVDGVPPGAQHQQQPPQQGQQQSPPAGQQGGSNDPVGYA